MERLLRHQSDALVLKRDSVFQVTSDFSDNRTTYLPSTMPPARWKKLLAFAIIYFVWGSTFYAIRVGVREVPPFLLAAIRFLVAGFALVAWMIGRGGRSPTRREWGSALILAILIFVLDY